MEKLSQVTWKNLAVVVQSLMQVHLAKGDLVPTPCMQFKLEEKMINNIRCRHRNPRPLPLKNFLLRYAGVRLSLGFALSFLTTDPSLFISV